MAGDGGAIDRAARQSVEMPGGIGNLMRECALRRVVGASTGKRPAADGRQKRDLVAFGERRRGRGKLLVQCQHSAGCHLAELGETSSVMFKHGIETAALRDVERVL